MQLGNHLGNVLTTVSDKKTGVSSGGIGFLIDYYEPDIVSANDYYPFGMTSRVSLSTKGVHYRYGFNGQENDWEIKGWQNMTSATYWEYDARIGKRWNRDPRPMVGVSEYSAFNNNPIWFSDPLGDTTTPLMPRHPINGPRDYGYVPYNIIGSGVNWVQSLLSKGGDYVNVLSKPDPVAAFSEQVGKDYNAVKGFVSGEINYFRNTPNDKILADTKEFFTNPDNYFQAFENTVAIMTLSGAPKLNVTKNFTLKVTRTADVPAAVEGGLNLFKFKSPQAEVATGWKIGDRF